MTAAVLDGKALAAEVKKKVAKDVKEFRKRYKKVPGLAVVLVGKNAASELYVRNKKKACDETGIFSKVIKRSEKVREKELLQIIQKLNKDKAIHGILVQLPLPEHIHTGRVLQAIAKDKDVDGFTIHSLGKVFLGNERLVPATAKGVIALLEKNGISLRVHRI